MTPNNEEVTRRPPSDSVPEENFSPKEAAEFLLHQVIIGAHDHESILWSSFNCIEYVFRIQTVGRRHRETLEEAIPQIKDIRRQRGSSPVALGRWGTSTTASEMLLRVWEGFLETLSEVRGKTTDQKHVLWDYVHFAANKAPDAVRADESYFCAAVQVAADVRLHPRKYWYGDYSMPPAKANHYRIPEEWRKGNYDTMNEEWLLYMAELLPGPPGVDRARNLVWSKLTSDAISRSSELRDDRIRRRVYGTAVPIDNSESRISTIID